MGFGIAASYGGRRDRYLGLKYLFGFYIVAWLPLGLYLLLAHFSWSWWFFVDEMSRHRALLTFLPLFVELLTTIAGYAIVVIMVDADRAESVNNILAVMIGVLIATLVMPLDRYGVTGSWPQYHAKMGTPLLQSPRLLIPLAIGGAWMLLVGWICVKRVLAAPLMDDPQDA